MLFTLATQKVKQGDTFDSLARQIRGDMPGAFSTDNEALKFMAKK